MKTHYIYFHIGDFLGETLDFDATEIGAYWLLIIAHYKAGEKGLLDCDTSFAKITRLKKSKWLKIRPKILSKFVQNGSFFEQKTVQNLIKKRSKKEQNARANLLKSNNPDKTVGVHTINQITNNLLTSNQSIDKVSKDYKLTKSIYKPSSVSDEIWNDWLKHRKIKKATVTKTVISNIEREAEKCGWTLGQALTESCSRGWIGFKADWVNKDKANAPKKNYGERMMEAAVRGVQDYEAGDMQNVEYNDLP